MYQNLTQTAGFADMGPRAQVEVAGEDRVKFLNNFCTADVQALHPGRGTEAFICNVKGRILGHGFIYCGEESLAFETVPGQADALLGHLERYVIAEDVQLADVSEGWAFLYVGGAKAPPLLRSLLAAELPQQTLHFITAEASGVDIAVASGGAIGPQGYVVCCCGDDLPRLKSALANAGIAECEPHWLETIRIEAGMPLYGRDITDENLPQEVGRNEQAINFQKGCYLGQETVARIDALGHVNRLLVGVKFAGETPPPEGLELLADEKPAGRVTTAAYSPRLAAPLALAYLRAGCAQPGTRLTSALGEAEVVALPVV